MAYVSGDDGADYFVLEGGADITAVGGVHFPVDERRLQITVYGGGGGGGGGHGGSWFYAGDSGGPGGPAGGGQRRSHNYYVGDLEEGTTIRSVGGLAGIGGERGSGQYSGHNGKDGTNGGFMEVFINAPDGTELKVMSSSGGTEGIGGRSESGWGEEHMNDGGNGESTSPPFGYNEDYTGKGGKGGVTYHAGGKRGGDGEEGAYPGAGGGAGGGGGWEDSDWLTNHGGSGGNGGDGGVGMVIIQWGDFRNYESDNKEQFPPNYFQNEDSGSTRFRNYHIAKMLAQARYKAEWLERYPLAVADGNNIDLETDPEGIFIDIHGHKCYRNFFEFGLAVSEEREGLLDYLEQDMGMDQDDFDNITETFESDQVINIEAYYLNNFTFEQETMEDIIGYMRGYYSERGITNLRVTHHSWGVDSAVYGGVNNDVPVYEIPEYELPDVIPPENPPSTGDPSYVPVARSIMTLDPTLNEIAKTDYGEETTYRPYRGELYERIRSPDSYMEDVDGIEFRTATGVVVEVGEMERNATMAMILISGESWLTRTSGPTITETTPGGTYVYTTVEDFNVNFAGWHNEDELYNYDLVSDDPDNPLTGEERRNFYMDSDYTYYHLYTNLFWSIRDTIIRQADENGDPGLLIYEGETLDGEYVGSGKFFLVVDSVLKGNITKTIETIAATFNIKVHEKERQGFWSMLLGALVKVVIGVIISFVVWQFVTVVYGWITASVAGTVATTSTVVATTATTTSALGSIGSSIAGAVSGISLQTLELISTGIKIIDGYASLDAAMDTYSTSMSEVEERKADERDTRDNWEVQEQLDLEEARLERARKEGIQTPYMTEEERKKWDPFYEIEVEIARADPFIMMEEGMKLDAEEDLFK